jgi:hypothetical protein
MMMRVVLPFACVLLVSCSGAYRLTDVERSKFDPAVQRLLLHERVVESEYDTSVRPDGSKEYGLVVRSNNAEEIKKAGIRVASVFGDVVTVRVTLDELRKLVGLSSVRSVQSGSKNYPQ